jgi:uncharacterized membrane protein
MTEPDPNDKRPGDAPAQPGSPAQTPHASGAAERAAKLKEMQAEQAAKLKQVQAEQAAKLKEVQAELSKSLRHSPVVLEQQAQRAHDVQLRIADGITAFAGSMNFVYLHIALFTIWMLFIESKPWPTLTLIVSLEAIFLSTFVMIGQNRQAAFQQAKADHDFNEQELELKTNTQITREIHTLTTELHNRLLPKPTRQRS